MNLPNKLTILRMGLTVVFLILVRQEGILMALGATMVFALAACTDYYDGYLARKHKMETDFGKLMDPIADKFMILAAFVAFVRMNIVEDWMVVLILGREIVVTGVRFLSLRKGHVIAAEKAGKHKTVSQIVAIFVILGFIVFQRLLTGLSLWTPEIEGWWRQGIAVAMLLTVALTLISGASFFWNNRKLIQTQ